MFLFILLLALFYLFISRINVVLFIICYTKFFYFYLMIDLIKSQVLTDKTGILLSSNKYVFDVDRNITKLKVKVIIEEIFGVKVISVNSFVLPSKRRRLGRNEGMKNRYKRIIVTLAPNQNIPFFSSL